MYLLNTSNAIENTELELKQVIILELVSYFSVVQMTVMFEEILKEKFSLK